MSARITDAGLRAAARAARVDDVAAAIRRVAGLPAKKEA